MMEPIILQNLSELPCEWYKLYVGDAVEESITIHIRRGFQSPEVIYKYINSVGHVYLHFPLEGRPEVEVKD